MSFTTFETLKNQSITTASPTEVDRTNRNGVISSCSSVKANPGTIPGTLHYNDYVHTSDLNNPVCVQVTVTTACAESHTIFAQSYESAFEPSSIVTNYVGDAGASATTMAYSYMVAPGHTYLDVVNATDEGEGCEAYEISWGTEAPWNSASPTVPGSPVQGQALGVDPGTWNGNPAYAYQWQQCASSGLPASCVPIQGATSSSYVPAATDVGHTLRAIVFAINTTTLLMSSTYSTVSAVVAAPPPAPASPPAKQPAVTLAPQFTSGPSESASSWRLGNALAQLSSAKKPPVGTKFTFGLSEAATARLSFAKLVAGRVVGGKCVKESKTNARKKKCSLEQTAGVFSVAASEGTNTLQFQGRITSTKKLTLGSYVVAIAAINGSDQTSPTKTLHFTIVR